MFVPIVDFYELTYLSRTPTVYLVSRRLSTAILYLPYPRFGFPATFFTPIIALTNLRSAGQPTANAVSRSMLFSRLFGSSCAPLFSSLSSFLRKKDRALPGPRSLCAPAQVCMYAFCKVLCRYAYTHIKSNVALKDGNGQQAYSATATVQDGRDTRYGDICSTLGPLS